MKIFLWALLTLFVVGCSSESSQEKKQEAVQVAEVKAPAVVAVKEVKIEKKVEKIATKEVKKEVLTPKVEVATSNAVYQRCKSCHGEHAENQAMNQSKIIAGWSAEKIAKALNGYKDGSYGGKLKGLMKAQVAALSAKDIQSVAHYISTMK